MGASDPSNSDNLNGDSGVGVCVRVCTVCVCCVCVCVMCLQHTIIFDPEKMVSLYFIQITQMMISPQWVHG